MKAYAFWLVLSMAGAKLTDDRCDPTRERDDAMCLHEDGKRDLSCCACPGTGSCLDGYAYGMAVSAGGQLLTMLIVIFAWKKLHLRPVRLWHGCSPRKECRLLSLLATEISYPVSLRKSAVQRISAMHPTQLPSMRCSLM